MKGHYKVMRIQKTLWGEMVPPVMKPLLAQL